MKSKQISLPMTAHDRKKENASSKEVLERNLIKKIVQIISGHEFKTPLTTILGISELLRGNFVPIEQKKVYYQFINDSGHRLEQLSARINLWYHLKYEADNYKISDQVFEVSTLDHMIKMYKKKELKHAKTEIITDTPTFYIRSNHLIIESIFKELIDNAFKYSTPQTPILFKFQKKNKELLVSVSNYLLLPNITENNSDTTLPVEPAGLGLGLEIIRMGLERAGGKLKVSRLASDKAQSQITFVAKFPLADL